MTRVRRLLLALVLPLVAVPVLVTAAAGPAHACSCVMADADDYTEWADAVFVGTVGEPVEPTAVPETGTLRGYGASAVQVAVTRVYQGDVADEVSLDLGAGSSCGLGPIPAGREWLFYASGSGDALAATLCSGSSPARPAAVAAVERILGRGQAVEVSPSPADPSPAATPDPTPGDDGQETAGSPSEESDGDALPWVLAGALVLAAAGAVVVRRIVARR